MTEINPLFSIPFFKTNVTNWKIKKKKLLKCLIKKNKSKSFNSDRAKAIYKDAVKDILKDEINEFQKCVERKLYITDMWSVSYKKKDFHPPHTHGGSGFSAILFLEFNPKVHESTTFIQPWNDEITDKTVLKSPNVKEGDLIIFPANILHYTNPNKSVNKRTIISWDLKYYE